jgi:hypothetical protein
MGTPTFTPHVEERRSWMPLAIGAAVVIVVLIAAFALSRSQPQATGPAPEDPYSSNLKVINVQASQAQNFAGGNVYYLEGQIANMGSKTITGATVEAVFRNSLGEVVDRQTQPLTIIEQRPGYNDSVSLTQHPLTPNMQDQFRLTFEHISADWNQGVPELRFTRVNTQ